MPNGMYGGVRGRKTKVGRKLLLFSSYSIIILYRKEATLPNKSRKLEFTNPGSIFLLAGKGI